METISTPTVLDSRLKHTQPDSLVEQTALSYCLLHTSTYPQFPLPQALSDFRVMHFDREQTDEKSFYVKLLTTIRDDLPLIHKFTIDSLKVGNKGTPKLQDLAANERKDFLASQRCSLCGYCYGRPSPKGANQVLRKALHHNHLPLMDYIPLSDGERQTLPICTICNLAAVTALHRKVMLPIATHGGSNYDLLMIARGAICYGNSLFPVRAADGAILAHRRLLKKPPTILMRDSNSVLTIKLLFSCPELSCKACQQKNKVSQLRKKGKLVRASSEFCIYSRAVVLNDSCAITQISLDKGVSDLAETAKAKNIPISQIFPNTYSFAKKLGLSDAESARFATQKITMPFSKFRTVSDMKNIVSPPDKSAFTNDLANTNLPIDDNSYKEFVWSWKRFQCRNLLDLSAVYICADTAQLGIFNAQII